MKKRLISLVFLLLIPLVLASSQLGNVSNNIQDSYGAGEKISGWINISFSNEFIDVNLSSNYGVSAKLINLIDPSWYSCSPVNCLESYASTSGQETKSFSLASGEEKLLSLVLSGNLNDITSLSFSINGVNAKSCVNPLKVSLFNTVSLAVKKTGSDYSCFVGNGRGCYNASSTTEVFVGDTPYCEKIKLIDSDKFRLGAWLRKDSGSGNPADTLVMILFNLQGDELAECNLAEPTSTGGEKYCDVTYQNNEKQDFYVCIRAKNEIITRYVLLKEEPETNPCGFFAYPGQETEYYDYYIFAGSAKFENIGKIDINSGSYEDLLSDVKGYVDSQYKNNCSAKCSIPLLFSAYNNVDVSVYNLSLYYRSGGGTISEKKIYDATKTSAKFSSSGFVYADLNNMNITLPSQAGNYTLILSFNGEQILSKKITIGNVPVIKKLTPLEVPAGAPTKFTVEVQTAGKNITSYKWNFGDGGSQETTKNYVSHAYASIKSYDMTIEIEDSSGTTARKTFSIISGNPKDYINSTIKKYKSELSNLTNQIANLGWYKSDIEEKINITYLQKELIDLEKAFYSTQDETDYVDIMNQLAGMQVPNSIKKSGSSIPFYLDVDKINPAILKEAGAGNYDEDNEQAYKEAVVRWADENLNMTLEFEYVSAYYDDKIEPLLAVFKLKINNNGEDEPVYFVIENPVALKTANAEEKDNYAYAAFDSIPAEIDFTSADIQISELVLYLSPSFDKLDITVLGVCNYNNKCETSENSTNCSQDCRPWFKAWILWIILAIAAVIAYIFLQWWYKVRYESSLFKNRNDIYNMLNFMSNAKSQGMPDSEISGSLKKSGWTGEQIKYVFKKMRGKAIMPFDFLKFFRKKENRYPINR